MQGLSVSRVVDVEVQFTPQAIPTLRFDTLLVLGDSGVIDPTSEVMREYNALEEVAGDLGTAAPEYQAAVRFFAQVPKPATMFIGAWARTATAARVTGGALLPMEQLITNWNTISDGGLTVTLDGGTSHTLGPLDFSAAANLNAVAAIVKAALDGTSPGINFVWDAFNDRFVCTGASTGPTSTIVFAPPGTGTDVATQMKMTPPLSLYDASGMAAESPVACVARVDGRGWYAVTFAASVQPTDTQNIAVCGYVEAAADKHIFGITTADPACLDAGDTTDIGSQAQLAQFSRTCIQFSSDPYAINSFLGRALTTNFEGSNTTITMKFKSEPVVMPELISASQASTLMAKRINVYAMYNMGVPITQEGMMSGRVFFDEMHGVDWLANRIQTDLFNVLYRSPKIPQTDPGVHVLVTTCDGGLSQGVTNGLIAPGVWNAPGFGELNTGDLLTAGWYTFAASVNGQDQTIREQRIAPLIQVAVKLAGAIHFSDVLINVNR